MRPSLKANELTFILYLELFQNMALTPEHWNVWHDVVQRPMLRSVQQFALTRVCTTMDDGGTELLKIFPLFSITHV